MIAFYVLLFLLILSLGFFISYPFVLRKVLPEKFSSFCDKKIDRICKKNDFIKYSNYNIQNFDIKSRKIDQVIFAKKYIYIVSNICLLGEVSGDKNDHSWCYKKRETKETSYIDNIIDVSEQNIQDFAGIINANHEIIVAINVIPNECQMNVSDVNKVDSFVIHYSSLNKLLKKLESREVSPLDKNQLEAHINLMLNTK